MEGSDVGNPLGVEAPAFRHANGSTKSIHGRCLVYLALLLILIGSAGCARSLREWVHNGFKVGPNYHPPTAPVACEWIDSADPKVTPGPADDCLWWTAFDDPQLNGLIEAAVRQNLDLRTAGARILEVRAQRGTAIGNLFPQQQGALGGYAHVQDSQNLAISGMPLPGTFDVWLTGLNASWEPDFWGRYRRTIESANGELNASVEDLGVTLVMLLSEVANSYIQLRTFETRLDFARKNVELQTGTARIARNRFKNGMSTELDLRQAESNLAQTQTLIPPLVIGRRQASNRLCVLLGMPVDDLAGRLAPAPIPRPPLQVAVGIPADLIRRRADIRRAERHVAAQSARIGIAASDLYPRFFINGLVGYAATDFKDLFSAKSFTGVVLPAFQWNLLNYGRITNNIRVQDARLEQAVFQYRQTVLIAGREVEDALVAFLQTQEQALWSEESVAKAQRSVELVVDQFEGGTTDFNRVFNTQSLLVAQQDQLASVRGSIARSLVDLYRALGGGWQCFLAGQGLGCALPVQSVPLKPGEPAGSEAPQPPAERLPAPASTPEN